MDSISASKFARLSRETAEKKEAKANNKTVDNCIDFVARGMFCPPVIYVNGPTELALGCGPNSLLYIYIENWWKKSGCQLNFYNQKSHNLNKNAEHFC